VIAGFDRPDEPARAADAPATRQELARPARLVGARWADDGGDARDGARQLRHGAPIALDIEWQSDGAERRFHVGIGIDRADGVQVCSFATHHDGLEPFPAGARQARLHLPELPMLHGEFALYVFLLDESGLHIYDQLVVPGAFQVTSEAYRIGMVAVGHEWQVSPASALPVARLVS